jgi:hypothetical protein
MRASTRTRTWCVGVLPPSGEWINQRPKESSELLPWKLFCGWQCPGTHRRAELLAAGGAAGGCLDQAKSSVRWRGISCKGGSEGGRELASDAVWWLLCVGTNWFGWRSKVRILDVVPKLVGDGWSPITCYHGWQKRIRYKWTIQQLRICTIF